MQQSLQCGFEQDSTRRNQHQMQSLRKFNIAASKCASNTAGKASSNAGSSTAKVNA
jgi:hypothetical protein